MIGREWLKETRDYGRKEEKGRKKKQRVGTSDGGGKRVTGKRGETEKNVRLGEWLKKKQMEGMEGEGREE